jgi:ureidoglycolate hydrolase
MIETVEVALEALNEMSFSPYGYLLAAPDEPADFLRPGLSNWRLSFKSDAEPRLQVMRYGHQQMRLSRFESHLCVTEARAPIGSAPAVLIVAGDPNTSAPPTAASVRAFLLDGTVGIMFHAGVWHGLDCFPVSPPFVDYLFLSDSATEDEIETIKDPAYGVRTQIFDFDMEFVVTDPLDLMADVQVAQ